MSVSSIMGVRSLALYACSSGQSLPQPTGGLHSLISSSTVRDGRTPLQAIDIAQALFCYFPRICTVDHINVNSMK